MKDLFPFEIYESAVRRMTAPRTAIVMAVLWGVPTTAYLVYARGDLGITMTIATGAVGASLVGVGWTVWMRTSMVAMARR
jgi:hypothetical protein